MKEDMVGKILNSTRKLIKEGRYNSEASLFTAIMNDTVSIHDLGAENLTRIFAILSAEGSNTQWVVVLGVCRYWLITALLAPSLWTRIRIIANLSDVGYIDTCLRRSRKAPLEFLIQHLHCEPCSNGQRQDVERVAQLITKEAHRIRVLDVHGQTESLNILASTISMPLPNLEFLHLSSPVDWSFRIGGEKPEVSTMFDTAHFPKLRSLALDDVDILWNSSMMRSLTGLTLHGVGRASSMETFLAVLEGCPELERLEASCPPVPERSELKGDVGSELGEDDDNEDDEGPTYPPPLRVVSLPRMRSVQLKAELEETGWFLSHLSLPPRVIINIRGPMEVGEEYDIIPYIMAALPPNTSHLPSIARLRSVTLKVNDESAEIQAFAIASCHDVGPRDCRLKMVFSDWLAERAFGYLLPGLTARVAHFFQPFHITELRLRGQTEGMSLPYSPSSYFCIQDFMQIFKHLSYLERLELDISENDNDSSSVSSLFESLDVPSQETPVLCPCLNTLVLATMWGTGMKLVLKSLRSRSDRGARLRMFSLPDFYKDGDIAKLRELVDTVLVVPEYDSD